MKEFTETLPGSKLTSFSATFTSDKDRNTLANFIAAQLAECIKDDSMPRENGPYVAYVVLANLEPYSLYDV